MNDERTHYRLSEISRMTGLSKSFLRGCVDQGLLRATKFQHSERVWLISAADLSEFLEMNLIPVTRDQPATSAQGR